MVVPGPGSVGKYDHELQAVTKAKDDTPRTMHDALSRRSGHSLQQASIKFYGGGRNKRPCKHIFAHLIQTFEGADKRTQKKLNGAIVDLRVDFTSLGVSAPVGSDAASGFLGLVRAL